MANYYGSARTNYFEVKDKKKFIEALSEISVSVHDGENNTVCILSDEQSWPMWSTDPERTEEEVKLFEGGIVQEYLLDGSVCIYMEIGSEKLRYLVGYAVAFNNRGETEYVSIDDIYDKAILLGNNITIVEG